MNKILVVNVNWMGDVIFSSPVFRALKETYPGASVTCLAVPRVKEILESIDGIDEIIIYDDRGRHRHPLAKWGLINEIRKRKFDTAFLLHRSLTRALLVFLSGIPRRVGYGTKAGGIFLTDNVKLLSPPVHRSDEYCRVIETLGVKVHDRTTVLKVHAASRKEVEEILRSQGIKDEDPFIVVHPGANWDLKRWPAENFACLINELTIKLSWKVVVAGSKEDGPLVQKIIQNLKSPPVILTGRTNLKQLIALMERARIVISADSGPLHLAGSVGTSAVALFGPTRPEITGPRGRGRMVILKQDVGCNRQACYHLQCPDNICMQALTVESVLDAIEQISNS